MDAMFVSFEDHADSVEELAQQVQILAEMARQVADRKREAESKLGQVMGTYQVEVSGKVIRRHKRMSRRNWQHDDLLRLTLDSDRRLKSPTTGEVESDLDVLKDVYGLRGYNASITKLRERGIDPDEFCDVDESVEGWTIEMRKA